MYSFVVLGQIPGTNITISFTVWLMVTLAIASIAMLYVRTARKTKTSSLAFGNTSNVMVMRNGEPVPADEVSL